MLILTKRNRGYLLKFHDWRLMLPTSFIILAPLLLLGVDGGDKFMSELLENLLIDYNRNVRPVKNASDALKVKFGASLCRLIDVDEVNQVLTTSLWLEMQWRDRKLVWNPADWGGIHEVHIPSDQIWIPDILLYNNADGEPHITVSSLARVDYNGTVLWQPPSIYKSLCPINIEYFPYDIQECFLKFGGWSNDGQTLDMEQIPVNEHDVPEPRHMDGQDYHYLEEGMGLAFFHESAEWDLLSVTSSRYAQIYPGCCGQQYYIDIRYNIVIRRKAIFFTVMLTIPCMLIANLTPFVFVIPPNEHKMTFSISTFVAFSVFYLVLIELLPPTSLVLPLIGKYLLFTLFMIFGSILISVWTIQIYRKQAFVSEMKDWQRLVFVRTLPKYLWLKQLKQDDEEGSTTGGPSRSRSASPLPAIRVEERPPARNRIQSLIEMDESLRKFRRADMVDVIQRIAGNLKIISANFNNQQLESKITDEWRLMSLVIDRIFLSIYVVLNLAANFLFIWNSRSLYDTRASLGKAAAFKPLSGDSLIITEGLNQV